MIASLVNMGVRGAGLFLRFALTIFIAKFLDLRSLGVSGLIFAGVALAPALLSFGLHYQANRRIVGVPIEDAGRRMRDRTLLHVMVVSPLGISIVLFAGLPEGVSQISAAILMCIVLSEVVGSDIYLALLSLRLSLTANTFLFFRASSWILPFVACAYVVDRSRTVDAMIWFWLGGSVAAYVFLAVKLRGWPWRRIFALRPDFHFFFENSRSSLLIYISDISIVGAQFADRAIIGSMLGIQEAGVYIFFWSIANGVQQLITTGVVQVSLPGLVEARQAGRSAFRSALRSNMISVLVWSAALGLVTSLVVVMLIPLVERPELAEHRGLVLIILTGTTIKLASDLMNYGLYASKRDTSLATINILSILISFLLTAIAVWFFGLIGSAVALVVASAITLCLRAYQLRQDL